MAAPETYPLLSAEEVDEATRRSLWRAVLPAAFAFQRAGKKSGEAKAKDEIARAAGAFDALARVRHACGLPALDRHQVWNAALKHVDEKYQLNRDNGAR